MALAAAAGGACQRPVGGRTEFQLLKQRGSLPWAPLLDLVSFPQYRGGNSLACCGKIAFLTEANSISRHLSHSSDMLHILVKKRAWLLRPSEVTLELCWVTLSPGLDCHCTHLLTILLSRLACGMVESSPLALSFAGDWRSRFSGSMGGWQAGGAG